MTVTAARTLTAPDPRPAGAAAKQAAPGQGGHAFGAILDGVPVKTAGKAAGAHEAEADDAGSRGRPRPAARPDGKAHHPAAKERANAHDDAESEEPREAPARGPLPLLVSLQHLSGIALHHRGAAGDGEPRSGPAAAASRAEAGDSAPEKGLMAIARPAPEIGQKAPAQPAAAVLAGMAQDGTALSADDAGASSSAAPGTPPARPARTVSAHMPQSPAAEAPAVRDRDGEARPAAVTASQSFAAPASYPLSQAAAGLVASIAADPAAMPAAAAAAPASAAAGAAPQAHILKLELHPAELGSVTASLRMAGQRLSVEIAPESHEAYRRLSADADEIMHALKRLGIEVDAVTVMQPQIAATPAARTDAAAAAGNPGRGDASFQAGGSNGGGAGGRQPERNRDESVQDGSRNAPVSRMPAGGGLFI